MNPKKIKLLAGRVKKSPSFEYQKALNLRTTNNGGVNIDTAKAIESVRVSSRQLNEDITKRASFIYTPSSYGESRNYVVKPELKNLFTRSEEADDVTWSKGACSVTANSIAAPDGNVTADLLIEDVTNNRHRLQKSSQINLIGGQPYNLSAYVKKASHDWIQINPVTSSDITNYANFNLTTGTIGNTGTSGSGAIISNEGNGWYRCSIVFTPLVDESIFVGTIVSTNNINSGRYPSYTGTGASVAYPWGFQLTKGAELLPYQRTTDGIIDFNFTRATTATVTNKDGSIGDSCYNLFLNSALAGTSGSPTSWVNNSIGGVSTSIVSNIVPSQNAYNFQTSSSRCIYQQNLNKTAGVSYTISCYVEKVTVGVSINQVLLILGSNTSAVYSKNNAIITPSTIIEPGNYYSLTLVSSISEIAGCRIGNGVSSITTGDITISSPQLTQGSIILPYLKTTNRQAVPRIDYSLNLTKPSLLIEHQSTNLITVSDPASDTGSSSRAGIVYTIYNWGIGLNNAVVYGDNTIARFRYQGACAASTQYTFSCYVVMDDNSKPNVGNTSGTDDFALIGAGVNIVTTAITYLNIYGSIWRITGTFTSGVTTLSNNGVLKNTTASAKGFKVSGYQLETGSNATTYIPTTTAAVTRNAETSYVDLWNNNMLNKDNFTLYVEGYLYGNSTNNKSVCLSDTLATGANSNDIGFYSTIRWFYSSSGTIVAESFGAGVSNNNYYKFTVQRNGTQVKYFRNGNLMSTQTVPVFDYRYLTVNNGGSAYTVSKIELYKETLSDADCVIKTTL